MFGGLSSIAQGISNVVNSITSGITTINEKIGAFITAFTNVTTQKIAEVLTKIDAMKTAFETVTAEKIADVVTKIDAMKTAIVTVTAEKIADIVTKVEAMKTAIVTVTTEKIADVVTKIETLPALINALITVTIKELFLPNANNLQMKFDTVKDKFLFITDVKTLFNTVTDYLLSGTSQIPQITVNLNNAEGSYNYGNTALVLDLSWYTRYKDTVDKLIIAFCYLSFIFLVFKRIPEIISGNGAYTEMQPDLDRGYKMKWKVSRPEKPRYPRIRG